MLPTMARLHLGLTAVGVRIVGRSSLVLYGRATEF
jgi:hypothetical protein